MRQTLRRWERQGPGTWREEGRLWSWGWTESQELPSVSYRRSLILVVEYQSGFALYMTAVFHTSEWPAFLCSEAERKAKKTFLGKTSSSPASLPGLHAAAHCGVVLLI